jgi:hypothetical protein
VVARPIQNHKRVCIGDGEAFTGQIGFSFELALQQSEPFAEGLNHGIAHLRRRLGLEKRSEALVQLGRNEVRGIASVTYPPRVDRGRFAAPARQGIAE